MRRGAPFLTLVGVVAANGRGLEDDVTRTKDPISGGADPRIHLVLSTLPHAAKPSRGSEHMGCE